MCFVFLMSLFAVICQLKDAVIFQAAERGNFFTVCFLCGSVVIFGTVAMYLKRKLHDSKERKRLKLLTQRKKAERDEVLQRLKSQYRLEEGAKLIVELPVDQLVERLQNRSLTAETVLAAFIAKAIEATDNFNCVTEFIPQAMQWAKKLDDRSDIKGPLHGLPVCIKEDTDVEGMDTTLGYSKLLYKPAKESATLVKVLVDLGAVPFCKTNVPQSLISWGSDNPIFGTTVNCLNVNLNPGGSSSGSGSLIGAGASHVGTGSDIAGSLRIPAHFNGICSIKPTLHRLSGKGLMQSVPKCVGLTGVPGIMANDVKILSTVFKHIVSDCKQNLYDPQAIPLPWDNKTFESKRSLRIGYYTSLSVFPALGDTEETVLRVKKALESLGHELVPFSMPNDVHMLKVGFDILTADFGTHSYLSKMFKHETIAKTVETTAALCGMSMWSRKLTNLLCSLPFQPNYSSRIKVVLRTSLDVQKSYQLWECLDQQRKFKDEILRLMQELKIDLILCPVLPFPAGRICDTAVLSAATVYTFIWNLMDFPAGVIRYGKESGKNIEQYDDQDDDVLKLAKEGVKGSINMPIGVQLVGKPFKEELVLRVMVELDGTNSSV